MIARDQLTRAGFVVTPKLLPGSPASMIAEQVARIDLLVMGAYGNSQIREFS